MWGRLDAEAQRRKTAKDREGSEDCAKEKKKRFLDTDDTDFHGFSRMN